NVMDPGECDEPTPIRGEEDELDNVRIAVTGCTGKSENCPIHTTNRPRWMYLAERDGIDKLLDSLNPRGFREIDLAEVVSAFKPWLSQAVDKIAEMMSKFEEKMKQEQENLTERIDKIKEEIPLEN